MSWALLIGLAALTVASRVLPMTLLPEPTGRSAAVLDVLPAPLFAALAAVALLGDGPPTVAALTAAAGALVGSLRRSLAWVLALGLVGYAAGVALTS